MRLILFILSKQRGVTVLDVHKLALLREVALHGSVTGAARSLQMSASNISQRLSRLEQETGVQLLETVGRGVILTDAAWRLVGQTEDILAALEEAEADLSASRDALSGRVRLVGFHSFALRMLAEVAAHLREIAPALNLEFRQLDPDDAIDEVLARRADVAVADEYPGIPLPPTMGLVRTDLGREPIRAFLPTPDADPAQVHWAMEPRHTDSFRWSVATCRKAGFEPRVRFESPDPSVHRQLVERGVAAAFLPSTIGQGIPDALIHPGASMYRTVLTVVRRGTHRSPAIEACRQAIAHSFTALQAQAGWG